MQFGTRSNKRRKYCHPDLIRVSDRALEISAHRRGPDFTIPKYGGSRSAEEQNSLFLKGRSKADGYKKKSNHQRKEDGYSHAIDVIAYIEGKASFKQRDLYEVSVCMLQAASELGVRIRWGGNYRNKWDKPHYELI